MTQILYTVACTITRPEVAESWLAWMRGEHVADVCRAGALGAQVVRLDGEVPRFETHYRFASRAAFETYEREQAPRLRAEGLAKFPLELGLEYERRVGEIAVSA